MLVLKEFAFGDRLRRIRLSRGLNQVQLGAMIGVVGNVISNWETNISMPKLALFRELCIALNCPPGNLLGLSPSEMSGDEYNLIKGFRQLNDAGRFTMMALLDAQLEVNRSDG